MDELDLLMDMHVHNARQGPGCDEETRRAVELARLEQRGRLEVADFGCGTGASAMVLARSLDARITAIDAVPGFVERMRIRVGEAGLSDRIDARVGDMASPAFEDGRFDVIWAEGSIYNIGFESGLRDWRRLLKPRGVLAVSELSWTTSERPAEVDDHWSRAYPGIATASEKLRTLEQAGYEPVGMFFLPSRCWIENYYAPLRAGFPAFLERHRHSEMARSLVASEEAEMQMFDSFGRWYGYGFYIARRVD